MTKDEIESLIAEANKIGESREFDYWQAMIGKSKIILNDDMVLEIHDFHGVCKIGFVKNTGFRDSPRLAWKPSREEPVPDHYTADELRQIAQILDDVNERKADEQQR